MTEAAKPEFNPGVPALEDRPNQEARSAARPGAGRRSADERRFTLSIAAVERDSGLTKDTLRVWERRYGFPRPQRDASGERIYSAEQVDKLRLLKRMMDQGYRPGKIINRSVAELHQLANSTRAEPARATASAENLPDLDDYLELVKRHDIDELRRRLSQAALRSGLGRFATDVVAPLNERVGDAWTRGEIEIFEEHLYTESVQVVLRNAISAIPRPLGQRRARPRVLLTTLPQEAHGLGVLMAEAVFALEGCHCVSLGVQTPLWDIVMAANAQQADIVALSFSAALNPKQVLEGLRELRSRLPAEVAIWAGGSCPVLHRRSPAEVLVVRRLDEIAPALAAWRSVHAGA